MEANVIFKCQICSEDRFMKRLRIWRAGGAGPGSQSRDTSGERQWHVPGLEEEGGGGGGGGKTGAAQSGERLRKGHLPVIWKQGWSERRGEEEAVILTLKDNTSAPGLVDSLCNFITPQSLPLSHTNTHTHTRRLLQDGSIKLNTINSVPLCASASLN